MITLVRQVLLPNYYSGIHVDNMGAKVEQLHQIMAAQIHRAMFQKCYDKDGTTETRAVAEEYADNVIVRLPQVQAMLAEDVEETYHGDPSATGQDEILLTYPGPLALLIYRIAHRMVELQIPLLPRMITEHAHRLTGIELHPGRDASGGAS